MAHDTIRADGDANAVRVSVIMPVFNAEATLELAIESILRQTFPTLEVIAIDDGSTDGSVAIVEALARRDARVRLIRQARNSGVAAARNSGLDAASGSHVAFLDSDDAWDPRKLQAQLDAMRSSSATVCYAAYRRVDESGKALSMVRPPAKIGYDDLLRSNFIGHLTGIYARTLGEFRFRTIGHEDYAFWLDVLCAAGTAVCAMPGESLATYTVRRGSVSANKLHAITWQWRIYRDVARLGWFTAARYMLHYAVQALRKRNPYA